MTDHPIIDGGDFRRVLGHFPTGVTVVTALSSQGPLGVAIGSFVSISLDPPLVGFFLGKGSGSGAGIQEAGHFCVNVLCADQLELCGLMASKAEDKFSGVAWSPAHGTHAPVLPGVLGVIDCNVDSVVEAGDHDLYIGRVQHLDVLSDGEPMIFFKGQYGTFGTLPSA
jgi:3-hydroxy-9,10-secoandrosta-1,3,5(10)-triene-9,17-dione monooxygenase reductase component